MGLTNPAEHGLSNATVDYLNTRGVFNPRCINGIGFDSGAFTATAAGVTTIADSNVVASSIVTFSPTNAAAGLLTASKTCWVDTIAAGSFKFNVSATGAGAPAGTETFVYHTMNPTDLDA